MGHTHHITVLITQQLILIVTPLILIEQRVLKHIEELEVGTYEWTDTCTTGCLYIFFKNIHWTE